MGSIDEGVDAQPSESSAENQILSPEEFAQELARGRSEQLGGAVAAENSTEDELDSEDYAGEEQDEGSEGGEDDSHGVSEPTEESSDSDLIEFLESATTEQIQELAQKGQSRLVSRIGELTKRAKQAEEQLAQLQSQQQEEINQSTGVDPTEPNHLSNITDLETLRQRREEAEAVKEWADDNLFAASDSGPDDVIVEANGRQFTKAEVRNALKMAKKDLENAIPKREKQLQELERLSKVQKQSLEGLRAQLPWMAEEDSDESKRLKAVLENPEVKKLKEVAPKLWAEFPVFAAHALNSIKQMQQKTGGGEGSTKTPRPKPPSGPNTAAGAPRKSDSRAEAGLKRLEERVKQTRSVEDFIALRAEQLKNR